MKRASIMKRFWSLILPAAVLLCLLGGCRQVHRADIAATTQPVYEFTAALCEGTPLQVQRLITENVSCLHDYTLQVHQMELVESAGLVILSGGGLEDFMDDALNGVTICDASEGIALHRSGHEGHDHGDDPHFWLSPVLASQMAENISLSLRETYPEYGDVFRENLSALQGKLTALQEHGETTLSELSTRELITFHDGFSYFAESFDLHILAAIEEESGSTASAATLRSLTELIESRGITSLFTEKNGSRNAADILSRETGARVCTLDMAMATDNYFDAMSRNIDTVKEALG